MIEKYRFNERQHLHELYSEEKQKYIALTGCTTITGVVAKPALIPWAAKVTIQYIREHAERNMYPVPHDEVPGHWDYQVTEEVLKAAQQAHDLKKTTAGTYGTKTHAEISELILKAIQDNEGYFMAEDVEDHPNKSVQNFINWAIDNDARFIESEKNIYSESLWLGGIVDFVCEIGGEIWIGDIKTSRSGIYPEHFWQIAGYHIMLSEMGFYSTRQVRGYVVLNLKESGEIIEKRSISNDDNIKAFLACLEIYRMQEKVKNQII